MNAESPALTNESIEQEWGCDELEDYWGTTPPPADDTGA
jgi:hypothetical protein